METFLAGFVEERKEFSMHIQSVGEGRPLAVTLSFDDINLADVLVDKKLAKRGNALKMCMLYKTANKQKRKNETNTGNPMYNFVT